MSTYAVVNFEQDQAQLSACSFWQDGTSEISAPYRRWSTGQLQTHPRGELLLDSAVVQIEQMRSTRNRRIDGVVVCLPGTIRDRRIVARSSRLGIMEESPLAEALAQRIGLPSIICRDVDALALGEIYGSGNPAFEDVTWNSENLAYVLVNEGVGVALLFDGAVYHGAGSAGALGRMIVEQHGGFNETFAARGSLENYASRPAISANIVAEYLAERDRLSGILPTDRHAVRDIEAAIAAGQPRSLDVETIAACAEEDDELMRKVFHESASYMGQAISAMIVILNPPIIILGGGLVETSSTYSNLIQSYTRIFTYGAAWRRTSISTASCGDRSHVLGSALWAERDLNQMGSSWSPRKCQINLPR